MYDDFGNRMKTYENAFRHVLPIRFPIVLRVDGRAFHKYTKNCEKPFDAKFCSAMDKVAVRLCEEIDGAQIAYIQSDEISILLNNYKKLTSQAWFNNNIQKMVSISVSIASVTMSTEFGKPACFDARVFILPKEEVCNYFLWRQQDCVRNSIQMLARSLFSTKECYKKNRADLQEMCFQKGHNWNDLPTYFKRGRCAVKETYTVIEMAAIRSRWLINKEIPTFSQERNYIEQYLTFEE